MNQILSVEMPSNEKPRKKANIKSVIIFFCIVLIILGIAVIAIAIYSRDESPRMVNPPIVVSGPDIEIVQDVSKLNITVSSDGLISKVVYRWNNEEETQVNGNNEKTMTLPAINIPIGTNIFTITATDENGESKTYREEFVGVAQYNPSITLVGQNNNEITVKYESSVLVKQVSYKFDNGEVTAKEVNNLSGEILIKILEGKHVLTIEVINEKGETYKEEKDINIPTVSVATDGENFIIKAEDTSTNGLIKVKINMNGVEEEKELNGTTYENTIKLVDGENRLILVLTNSDGLSITKRVRWEKK